MNMRSISTVVSMIFLSFLLVGGCDIDFGTDDSGGGTDVQAKIEGTVTEITPDRSLDGIRVQITDESSGISFSDTTDINGIFTVEGDFSGNFLRLEFLDESQTLLALTSVTVFSEAEVDLGDITITNGSVAFENDIIVTYMGDLTENNCSAKVGTLIVENNDSVVIIQIDNSTDIERDNIDIDCDDLLIGDELEVRGVLLTGSTLDAFEIEI